MLQMANVGLGSWRHLVGSGPAMFPGPSLTSRGRGDCGKPAAPLAAPASSG